MKNFVVIVFLIFSINTYSQELKEKNWVVKLNAMQLVDIFSYPTLQFSVERKINPFYSINAEMGYQVYDLNERKSEKDNIFLKPKGFKMNIEGRLYLFKLINKRIKANRGELYVGLQFFYRENQSTNNVEYSPKIDSTKYFSDVFGTKRKAFGANIIIGHQMTIIKRIVLEPFIGIGLMNKVIKNSDIQYNQQKDLRGGTGLVPFFQGRNLEESSGTDLNLCAGFRIGYKF